jgi:hypothetical protein
MTKFDKQALRSVEVVVEDEENDALLCLGWIGRFGWNPPCTLPQRSRNECGDKSEQTRSGENQARP